MKDTFRERLARTIATGYEPDHGEPNRHDFRAADAVIQEFNLPVDVEKVANALHMEDHNETLDEHGSACVREDCGRKSAYLSAARRFIDNLSD